jgi:tetratricopeptide (TPR) repeat protein
MGKYEEALSWLDKAVRLDPIPLDWYFNVVGHCYLHMGKLEKALEELKKNRNQQDITNHIRLAAVYSLLGRQEDASAEAEEILRLNPKSKSTFFSGTHNPTTTSSSNELLSATISP